MKKGIYLALIATLVMGSCKREYLDINDNPNLAVASTALLTLPTALNTTANRLDINEIGALWGGHWGVVTTVTAFREEKSYAAQSNFTSSVNTWASCYDNIQDYDFVEQDAAANGQKAIQGIAQVMKVYNYQLLVDAFGNVPYTQALKISEGITSPVYDDAKTIYRDLIPKLSAAIVNLKVPKSTVNAVSSEDIYFKGDTQKWVKFANTLKLRILLRQSEFDKAYAQTEIAKLSGESFLGLNENVVSSPGFLKTAGKQNPFWNLYGFNEAGVLGNFAQFFGISDYARKRIEGVTTAASTQTDINSYPRDMQRMTRIGKAVGSQPSAVFRYNFIGIPHGVIAGPFGTTEISQLGQGILNSFDQPMVVMTASESLLLQAEAVQRGWLTGGASYQQLFKNAVISSFVLLKAGAAPLKTAVGATVSTVNWIEIKGAASDLDYAALLKPFDATAAVSTSAANEYLAYNTMSKSSNNYIVDIDNSPTPLKSIIEQKFICMMGFSGFQAWCDVRRFQDVKTGTPDILNVPVSPTSQSSDPNKRPMRLPYPVGEQQLNSANVKKASADQGYDATIVNKGIFWDVN